MKLLLLSLALLGYVSAFPQKREVSVEKREAEDVPKVCTVHWCTIMGCHETCVPKTEKREAGEERCVTKCSAFGTCHTICSKKREAGEVVQKRDNHCVWRCKAVKDAPLSCYQHCVPFGYRNDWKREAVEEVAVRRIREATEEEEQSLPTNSCLCTGPGQCKSCFIHQDELQRLSQQCEIVSSCDFGKREVSVEKREAEEETEALAEVQKRGYYCVWRCVGNGCFNDCSYKDGKREAVEEAEVERRIREATENTCWCVKGYCQRCTYKQPDTNSECKWEYVSNCNPKREVVQKRENYCVRRCVGGSCFNDCSFRDGKREAVEEVAEERRIREAIEEEGGWPSKCSCVIGYCQRCGYKQTMSGTVSECHLVDSCDSKREVVQKREAGEERCVTKCPAFGTCHTICTKKREAGEVVQKRENYCVWRCVGGSCFNDCSFKDGK